MLLKATSIASEPLVPPVLGYRTKLGTMWQANIESFLDSPESKRLQGKIDLIFTSPPYPLVKEKKYGNKKGEENLNWMRELAPKLAGLLAPTGSLVIELGNAWQPGSPTMSTLPLRTLLAFQEAAQLHLCQHLVWHNPARLPSPAQWVTVERIRLKDSFTHVWWMSKTDRPKATNKNVLLPYSKDMQDLLRKGTYNAGRRPSGHVISDAGFFSNHGGSISPSVLSLDGEVDRIPESLLKLSNTKWDIDYVNHCRNNFIAPHPARMPMQLAGFMINMLTDKKDLVLDPFAGSNTTGASAESLGRRWAAIEMNAQYIEGSRARFATSMID